MYIVKSWFDNQMYEVVDVKIIDPVADIKVPSK